MERCEFFYCKSCKAYVRLFLYLVCAVITGVIGWLLTALILPNTFVSRNALRILSSVSYSCELFGGLAGVVVAYLIAAFLDHDKDWACRHGQQSILRKILNTCQLDIFFLPHELIGFSLIVGVGIYALRRATIAGLSLAIFTQWFLVSIILICILQWLRNSVGERPNCPNGSIRTIHPYFMPISTSRNSLISEEYKEIVQQRAVALRAIMNNPEYRGFIFMIDGDYGSGKSTFKNILLEKVWSSFEPKPMIVELAPWETLGEIGQQRRLLSELLSGICRKYVLGRYVKEWLDLLPSIRGDVKGAGILQWFFGSFSSLENRQQSLRQLFSAFHEKVLYVVEDLDRLKRKELEAILRQIDELKTYPNLYFLLVMDRERCITLLGDKGSDMLSRAAAEKVWHPPIPTPAQLLKYIKNELDPLMNQWIHNLEQTAKKI